MELSNIQQIKQAIMFGNLTNDDINTVIEAVKYARAQLTRQNARSIWAGDNVTFRDNKRGINHTGTVEKVKLKYALVRTTQGLRYNVPLNMLESV